MSDRSAARPDAVASLPEVCEVEIVRAPAGSTSTATEEAGAPQLLFEIPHGATATAHYRAIRRHLRTALPEDLIDFFHVNTDVGAFEYARRMAQLLVDPSLGAALGPFVSDDVRRRMNGLRPRSVVLVRCLIPRTFIDTNRRLESPGDRSGPGLTAAVNDYVRAPEDIAWLTEQHRRYHEVAEAAYAWVLGAGGLACTPHTYAPRSIEVGDDFDEGIGRALRAAYEPEVYATWNERPLVDLITAAPDGTRLAPERWVEAIVANCARLGWAAQQNATYALHPVSMGHYYASRYPGRVLCLEVRRDLLADPFAPFEEMQISAEKTDAVAAPLAAAYLEEVAVRT